MSKITIWYNPTLDEICLVEKPSATSWIPEARTPKLADNWGSDYPNVRWVRIGSFYD